LDEGFYVRNFLQCLRIRQVGIKFDKLVWILRGFEGDSSPTYGLDVVAPLFNRDGSGETSRMRRRDRRGKGGIDFLGECEKETFVSVNVGVLKVTGLKQWVVPVHVLGLSHLVEDVEFGCPVDSFSEGVPVLVERLE
jgi:hypothetical protein